MANAVEICNMALALLGDSASVASINPPDGSAAARMCSVFYPMCKVAILEMHEWSFALRRGELSKLEDEGVSKWAAAYQRPSDALRVVSIRSSDAMEITAGRSLPRGSFVEEPMDAPFEVLGRKIYTNAENPIATYITSEVSESDFTPTFVEAFAYYLAGHVAGSRIKGKEGQVLSDDIQKRFLLALSIAKSRDSNQQLKRVGFIPKWLKVR